MSPTPPCSPRSQPNPCCAPPTAPPLLYEDLRSGLNSLATITTLAPLIGIFGTACHLSGSLKAWSGSRYAWMTFTTGSIGEALFITVFALLVSILAKWFHTYLHAELETFDLQMCSTAGNLVNELNRYSQHFQPTVSSAPSTYENPTAQAKSGNFLLSSSAILFSAAWLVQILTYFMQKSYPIPRAAYTSTITTPIFFLLCLAPAHPVWRRVLHSHPGGHTLMTSALCLLLSVAQYLSSGISL